MRVAGGGRGRASKGAAPGGAWPPGPVPSPLWAGPSTDEKSASHRGSLGVGRLHPLVTRKGGSVPRGQTLGRPPAAPCCPPGQKAGP